MLLARTGEDPRLCENPKSGAARRGVARRDASRFLRDARRRVVTRVRVRARRRGEECANEGASGIIRGVHAWAARVYVSPPELRPEFRRRDRPQPAAVRTTPDSAPWRGAVRRPGIRGLRSLDGRRSAFFFLLATLIPRARRGGRGDVDSSPHEIFAKFESYYYEIRVINIVSNMMCSFNVVGHTDARLHLQEYGFDVSYV